MQVMETCIFFFILLLLLHEHWGYLKILLSQVSDGLYNKLRLLCCKLRRWVLCFFFPQVCLFVCVSHSPLSLDAFSSSAQIRSCCPNSKFTQSVNQSVRTQERLESLEVHHSKTPESESKGDLSLATILYACGEGRGGFRSKWHHKKW